MHEAEAELKGDLLMRIENLQNQNRQFIKSMDNFHVLEYIQDASVSPMNAVDEYFMSKMNVRRRQVVIDLDRNHSAMIQAGAAVDLGLSVEFVERIFGNAHVDAVALRACNVDGSCLDKQILIDVHAVAYGRGYVERAKRGLQNGVFVGGIGVFGVAREVERASAFEFGVSVDK